MNISVCSGRLRINVFFFPVMAAMGIINGAESVVALFTALFFHEGAHAVMASALGVRAEYLELLPFGCLAYIGDIDYAGRGRIIAMAAAGPAANIILAAAMLLLRCVWADSAFFASFMRANLLLGAMNLLPVLPLDGGRILRALLSMVFGDVLAQRTVSFLGIVFGAALTALGVYTVLCGQINPTLPVMGIFLLFAAIREFRNVGLAQLKQTITKRERMNKRGIARVNSIAVCSDKTYGQVLARMDKEKYNIVHIINDDMTVAGSVGEGEIFNAAVNEGSGGRIKNIAKI